MGVTCDSCGSPLSVTGQLLSLLRRRGATTPGEAAGALGCSVHAVTRARLELGPRVDHVVERGNRVFLCLAIEEQPLLRALAQVQAAFFAPGRLHLRKHEEKWLIVGPGRTDVVRCPLELQGLATADEVLAAGRALMEGTLRPEVGLEPQNAERLREDVTLGIFSDLGDATNSIVTRHYERVDS